MSGIIPMQSPAPRISAAPSHILAGVLPSERLIFASDLVCLGAFRSRPGDPGFRGGEPCSGHTVVFPRHSVWIQHEGGALFVADAARVPLYNRGLVYRRTAIDPRGDACEWMAFPSSVLATALADAGHRGQERPDAPFDRALTASSGALYVAQRRMFATAARAGAEAHDIEERALGVLDILISRHLSTRTPSADSFIDGVEHARRLIALEGASPMPLTSLAAACGMSPYRLCRDFKRATGMTISAYRTQVRVFASLDRLPRARDLSALALAAGFCSHSHFAAAFRRVLGTTPSALRRELRTG